MHCSLPSRGTSQPPDGATSAAKGCFGFLQQKNSTLVAPWNIRCSARMRRGNLPRICEFGQRNLFAYVVSEVGRSFRLEKNEYLSKSMVQWLHDPYSTPSVGKFHASEGTSAPPTSGDA